MRTCAKDNICCRVAGLSLNFNFGCVVRRASDLQSRHSGQPGLPHCRKGLFECRTLKRRIDNAALTLPFSAIGAKNAIYPQQAQDAPIRFVFRERQRPYFQDCFNQIRLVQQIRQENGVLNSAIKAPYNRAGCAERISRRNIEAYCQSDTFPWRSSGLGGR